MAGPLSQMYKERGGESMATPVHGPASIHEPSEFLRSKLEALISDESIPTNIREQYRRRHEYVGKKHEIAARRQELLSIYKSGRLHEADKLDLDRAIQALEEEDARLTTQEQTAREYEKYGRPRGEY